MFHTRISLALVARLLCAFLLLIPATAVAADMVVIETPDQVGVGKPFLVRIASYYPLEELTVTWDGKSIQPSVVEEGYKNVSLVILGVGLKGEPGQHQLSVEASIWGKLKQFSKPVNVVETVFQSETLTVEPKMVKPPKEFKGRIQREREASINALNTYSPQRHWDIPFSRPVKGKMLSRFGLHRVFNGHTKSRHTGLDFRAWEGTPLHSMASGTVILVGSFYYAGNCVFIDHGNGLVSLSCHMSKVLVEEGDVVEPGQRIGLSGATGRVNGAHLHLATFVQGKVVDPELFFDGSLEFVK